MPQLVDEMDVVIDDLVEPPQVPINEAEPTTTLTPTTTEDAENMEIVSTVEIEYVTEESETMKFEEPATLVLPCNGDDCISNYSINFCDDNVNTNIAETVPTTDVNAKSNEENWPETVSNYGNFV